LKLQKELKVLVDKAEST